MKFIPLCFLISLLVLLFNTQPLQGAEPESEPVVDIEGNPLQPGVGYYASPHGENSGGIVLGHTRNQTCPLDVILDPNSIGQRIFFTPPGDLGFIPTLTGLTIKIPIYGPCLEYSRIWKPKLVESGFPGLNFVSTGGTTEGLWSKFQIEKFQHAIDNIYSFKYCPNALGAICKSVGTFVDTDGTKVLAVGEGIDEPYFVRFHKSSTFPLKTHQDMSIV